MMLLLPARTPLHQSEYIDRVQCMDALAFLRLIPSNSVNSIITSPPYFGLRDYGVSGQIGLEKTPAEYVANLVMLFHEARRVLRDDGTFWLNLGDSYASGEIGRHDSIQKRAIDGKKVTQKFETRQQSRMNTGIPSKNLMMIPARVAIALQDDGWIIRAEIVWAKPNPMPESVTDRVTRSHEMVYMLTKSPRYWYDAEAIKEPAQYWGERDRSNGKYTSGDIPIRGGKHHGLQGAPKQDALGKRQYTGFNERYESLELRNKRDVWTVPPAQSKEAHFATFPPKLIEPMIFAGCPEGGIVLDPFMGSGTTALVARELGRHFTGCELNPDYMAIIERRLAVPYTTPMVFEYTA